MWCLHKLTLSRLEAVEDAEVAAVGDAGVEAVEVARSAAVVAKQECRRRKHQQIPSFFQDLISSERLWVRSSFGCSGK